MDGKGELVMSYFFSPSRLAFFHSDIPYQELPGDLVAVTDELHEKLMTMQMEKGMKIVAGAGGTPAVAPQSD